MRIFATATFVVLAALAVQSATLSVPGDYSTIQLAIDAASSGDIVEVADGIYTGTGNTSIELRGKLMTVRSANGPEITIIDCQNAGRGFYIHEGETNASTIQGFTIRNGSTSDGGGGMRVQNASITAINCIFRNSVAHQGGAVYINTPPDNPSFIGCQFIGNEADVGGAVAGETGPGLVLTSCTIVDNLGLGGGSAVSLISSEPATIDRCILAFNRGNCAVVTSTTPHITCTDIFGNEGGDWIGGIEDQEFTNDNISRDPAFCAPETGNYSLRTYSPCTSTNSPCDSLVGALGTESCSIKVPVPTAISLGAEDMTHVLDHNPSIEWTYLDVPTSIQSAYEIEVGTDDDWTVAEMWATGQTSNSYESMTYSGSPLLDGETYFLRIRVHNGSDWGSWLKLSFRMNSVPTVPVPVSPIAGTTVYWSTVILTTDNSDEADGDALTYDFELYSDAGHTTLVAEFTDVVEQPGQTMVGPVAGLSSEDQYWWRVRADDGYEPAAWSTPQSFSTPAEGTLLVPEHFDAIQAAIDAAIEGDEILVGPGDYREHLTFGSKSVSLIATGGSAVTFVTAVDSGRHVVEFPTGLANASLLEGFTVRDAHNACGIVIGEGNSPTIRYCHMTNNAGLDGAGIMCLGSDVQIRGCQFTNNRCNATKNDEGAGVFVTGDNVTIDSCVFAHNNSNEGAAGAIYTRYSSGLVVSRNLAYDNSSLGQGSGFMYAYSALNITVINNTIVGNHTNVRGAGISLIGTNYVDIRNNIIAFNEGGPGIWSPWDGTVTVEYNNIYGNTVGDEDELTGGIGSISTDPLFLDMLNDNYGLHPSSPCVNTGDPDPIYDDPDGTRNDMGVNFAALDFPLAMVVGIPGEDLAHVRNHTPTLEWTYLDYPPSTQSGYEIEVGTDGEWTIAEMWATGPVVGTDEFATYAGLSLQDAVTYFARVRVSNGTAWSSWLGMSFHMNGRASVPVAVSPDDGATVHMVNATLTVGNSVDPEGDSITYDFEVFADAGLTIPVDTISNVPEQTDQTSVGPLEMKEADSVYWWRVRSFDGNEYSAWTSSRSFLTIGYLVLRVPSEYPTIQAAIDVSHHLDTIALADGVYSGPENRGLVIRGLSVSIRSDNGPKTTIIDCESRSRAFYYAGGDHPLTVEGLTIRNGQAMSGDRFGGALLVSGCPMTLADCIFESNSANIGGALFLSRVDDVKIESCRFVSNSALYSGGAIYVAGTTLKEPIASCVFHDNRAATGGALATSPWQAAQATLRNCTIADNSATDSGSVFSVKESSVFTLESCIVAFNKGPNLTAHYFGTGSVQAACTDIFGNENGDWVGTLDGQNGVDGNFSANPVFCDQPNRNYSLRSFSPCAASRNECQILIGGTDIDCDPIMCGDANLDGLVDETDYAYLEHLYFGLGLDEYRPMTEADMDCDGIITIADLVFLSGYVYGYGPTPCCVEPPPPPPDPDPVERSANSEL